MILYPQPGKHAFSARRGVFLELQDYVIDRCGPSAGKDGLLITPLFEGLLNKTEEVEKMDGEIEQDRVMTAIVGSYPKPKYLFPGTGRELLDVVGMTFYELEREV